LSNGAILKSAVAGFNGAKVILKEPFSELRKCKRELKGILQR
jgi:hypothetical protein